MADFRPQDWPLAVWVLYGLGALYILGFLAFFFRIETAAKRAAHGAHADVVRYNRMLRGFPNSLYARMLGRRPLEEAQPGG